MYVDNLIYFGRLLDTSIFSTTRKHGDMYEMMNNVLVRFCCNISALFIENAQKKDRNMIDKSNQRY